MPVDVLRCRVCESDYPADRERYLRPLLRAARAGLRLGRDRADRRRASRSRPGPPSLWRYADLLPAEPPEDAASGPGLTPLVPAPRLAQRDRRRRGPAEARPREPDALVQGPRRRRRGGEGARVRARDAVGHLDRQPRERGRRARGRDGHARGDLLPGRARAREARGDDGLRRHASTASAAATTTARASSASSPARSTGASSTSTCARTTPRARRRSRSRSAEQLGWETPDAVVMPIGSGAMFTKVWQGFEQFERLGLIDGARPKLYGGQAEGCAPVASAFAEERRVTPVRPSTIASSIAIGNPADGDLAIAKARGVGRRRSTRCPRTRSAPNISLLAETGRHLRRGRDRRRDRRAARGGAPRRARRARPRRRARHRHRPEDAAARPRRAAGRRDRRRTSTRCSRSWE